MRLLALLAASLALASAAKVEFGLFDADGAPPTSGWTLASLAQIESHKTDFVAQYNSAKGLKTIEAFKSKNCCISLASGKMITIAGSPYNYQFPAAGKAGGIQCNPSDGYEGTYSFYRTNKISMRTQFGETAACVQKKNPAIWIKSVSSHKLKAYKKPAPAKKTTKSGHLCIDCETTAWSKWGSCSKLCGGGVHKRYRVVSNVPNLCGKPCPKNLEDARACNTEKCIKPNINDVTPGSFFTLKLNEVSPKRAMAVSKKIARVVTTELDWYPGWIKVEEVEQAKTHMFSTYRLGNKQFNLLTNKAGEPLSTNGEPVYKHKNDYLYFFQNSKGKSMWLVGPNRGSAKAHTIGLVNSRSSTVKSASWFKYSGKKWNKVKLAVRPIYKPSSLVQIFVGAPVCDNAMPAHLKQLKFTLERSFAKTEKSLGFKKKSISLASTRNHNLQCMPAIKLTVRQNKHAKAVKTECKWNGDKLQLKYKVPKGHAHNCFHKFNSRAQKWDCMCHTWSIAN